MSEASGGPGWWVASDGKWYPPASHPDAAHRDQWAGSAPAVDLGATAIVEPGATPPSPSSETPPLPPPVAPVASSPPPVTPPSTAPTSAGGGGRRRGALVAALVVFALVAAVVVVVVVARNGGTAEAVQLEPIGFPGDDPFATSITVHEVAVFPDDVKKLSSDTAGGTPVSSAPGGGVARSGTAPGLYGGTQDTKACDPSQVKSFFRDNPDKAKAWATVQGLVGPADIDKFIDGLTPVVLTSDTWVTNHGFKNGKATAFPAVLQAGTAVMVDNTGVPRMKCACGNPLLPPATSATLSTTRGTPWPGYTTVAVTSVQPGAAVTSLQIVNVQNGQLFSQPVGAASGTVVGITGQQAGDYELIRNTKGFDPSSWESVFKAPGVLSGIGYGSGMFVAVGQGKVYASDNTGSGWAQVAMTPDNIEDVAYGDGRWVGVGVHGANYDTGDPGTPVVYSSADAKTWSQIGTVPFTNPGQQGLGFWSLTFGSGRWTATMYDGVSTGIHTKIFTSTDAKTWTDTGTSAYSITAAYGEGFGWLGVGFDITDAQGGATGLAWKSNDGTTWKETPSSSQTIVDHAPVFADGQWWGVYYTPQGGPNGLTKSSDGISWMVLDTVRLPDGMPVWMDDFTYSGGPLPTGAGAGTATPSSTAPPSSTTSTTAGGTSSKTFHVTADDVTRRGTPDTKGTDMGRFRAGTTITVECQVEGGAYTDKVLGTSVLWDKLADGGYVADLYTDTPKGGTSIARCNGSAAPAPSAPAAGGGASAGPCTADAVQAVVKGRVVGSPRCAGDWATVGAQDSNGDESTLVLHWQGGAWTVVDRTGPCASGQIPPSIYLAACQTN